MAAEAGLAGVVLSNHGGRQLDFARSGIEVLVEVVRELKARKLEFGTGTKFEIFVDGGVRRATGAFLRCRAAGGDGELIQLAAGQQM